MAVIRYWKDIDVLDIVLKKDKYDFSEPIVEDVVLDISKSGEIMGIEIHHASKRFAKPLARRLTHRYLATR